MRWRAGVARHAGAAGLHRRRAGAGLVGPAPFAGADPPHRARARGASDLQPIKAPVPEELDTLVHTLDGFMARLAENLDTLRLFIAEAAHQLRTPLALHAQMEVALDEEDPPNSAAACWPCCATPRNCRGWSTSCSATPA